MNPSVLIVDDEAGVTLALEGFFRNKGFEVFRTFFGDQAIEQLNQSPPSLVILDLQMTGITGIAVLEKIRQGKMPTKTLVVTGYADNYQPDLDRLRPEGLLLKPASLEELTQAVEKILGQVSAKAPSEEGISSSEIRLLFVEGSLSVFEQQLKPYFENSPRNPPFVTAAASTVEQAFQLLEEFRPHFTLIDGTRLPIGVEAGKLAADIETKTTQPAGEIILYNFRPASKKEPGASASTLKQLEETIQRLARHHKWVPISQGG